MKSLRLRLTFKLGAAFVLIWALAAWMLNDLRNQMMFSLDQRLVASARMVAGLTEQMPGLASVSGGAHFSAEQLHVPGGMACQGRRSFSGARSTARGACDRVAA